MKKSLIALAALAASGFAMAQSSVTLFGVVDANVSVYDGQRTVTGMGNSGTSSSALGFRGVEDLGNGLKAQFWLEGAVGVDDGSGVGADATGGFEFKRRSTVSLLSNVGELRLGRSTTAAYDAVSRYDVFGTVGAGGSGVWGQIGGVRRDNMLGYYSADFAGFKINANYAFGEGVESSNDGVRTGNYYGVAATYDNGPISAAVSYFDQGRKSTTTQERDGWAIGGAYDFGVVKLSAAYQAVEAQSVPAVAATKVESDNFLVALSAPVGAAGVVKASYNRYQNETTAKKDKADHYSLGYVHSLSKRTAVYGTYSYLKNKNNGSAFTLGGAGVTKPALDNGKIQALQVGVRHSF